MTEATGVPMPRRVGVVLFDHFELLDVCGPLELFGKLPEFFTIELLARATGPVASAQGVELNATVTLTQATTPDIALVPGGLGTRTLVNDTAFIFWLSEWAGSADYITSVCTGAGLLGAAGLLNGYRATTNKRAFEWPRSQAPDVDWQPQARWVQDRNRWTSSGVAAGMDMTLALIAHLHGQQVAQDLADSVELDWHSDPSWDPFAGLNGLAGTPPG